MTTISKVRAAAYCAARCRLRSTLHPERPVIYLGIFLRVGIVISDRQMRAGMRSGGQKNGTVTSMPRGFERICLFWARHTPGRSSLYPPGFTLDRIRYAHSLRDCLSSAFQNAALFLARWGRQALDGFHQTLDRSAQAIDFIEPAIGGDAFPP